VCDSWLSTNEVGLFDFIYKFFTPFSLNNVLLFFSSFFNPTNTVVTCFDETGALEMPEKIFVFFFSFLFSLGEYYCEVLITQTIFSL